MNSILATDGYKFSMAEAGWPLRTETFYYSHRRGGPHFLPFDAEEMIRSMLPERESTFVDETMFLRENGYRMGGGYWEAVAQERTDSIKIDALPKGSWFFDREPAFSVTGPSALVSWLEPLALMLHYRIQVATIAKTEPERLPEVVGTVTCEAQKNIVLETLAAVGVKAPPITVDTDGYFRHVLGRVRELVQITGDRNRIFEVGMRAATCMEQHEIALKACCEAGVAATSNVYLAQQLNMLAVGTMGHEHVQRYGSDEAAFRAMRDRRSGASSFLLDTFSTIQSGLPTAFDLIAEDPSRNDTVRFDSGDKESQYLIACTMAKAMGINPRFILEDGFTAEMTQRFEDLRKFTGIPAQDQMYGFGGYIVKAPGDPLTRDRVAAVWKLTQTGPKATMKFGDEPGSGKESIPGRPVLYRVYDGNRWGGLVAQEGEDVSTGPYDMLTRLTGDVHHSPRFQFQSNVAQEFQAHQGGCPAYSPATATLVAKLHQERAHTLSRIGSN